MFVRAALLVVTAVVSVAACASDPCGRPPPCPNDPVPSQTDRDRCRAALQMNSSAPCYMESVAYFNCAQDNVACDMAGRTDPAQSSARAQMNCASQQSALAACCMSNADAAACR